MKTIKLIDLYKLIASDELKNETKFKYSGDYFKYWKTSKQIDRYTDNTYSTVEYYNDNLFDIDYLNDVVEIIEDTPKEDKKLEKLESLNTDYFMERKKYGTLTNEEIVLDIQTLKNYINKLVDKENGE